MTHHQLASELRTLFAFQTRLPKNKVNDFTDVEIVRLYNTCPCCHEDDVIPADILKGQLPDIDSAEEFITIINNLIQMREQGLIHDEHSGSGINGDSEDDYVEKPSVDEKIEIATQILRKSIELLTPLSNDVNGIRNDAQKDCISAVSEALGEIQFMDTWHVPSNEEFTTVDDLREALDSLNDWDVEYKKDRHHLN